MKHNNYKILFAALFSFLIVIAVFVSGSFAGGPPVEFCGNGILDSGEECDDGNNDNGDGCSSTCFIEVCGDNVLNQAFETCDPPDSPAGTGVCRDDCTYCGDGNTDAVEVCDPANPNDPITAAGHCSDTCDPGTCGDGIPGNVPGETCDPPGLPGPGPQPGICRDDCTFCGDGIVITGEECDDGNGINGDCCDSNCNIEPAGTACGDTSNTACDNPDSCDGAGACQPNYEPVATDCGDGVFCNGWESCDGSGLCAAVSSCPHSIIGCVSFNAICDEDNDTCIDVVEDSQCNNREFCDGTETCDGATGDCIAGSVPCLAGETCDDVNDICIAEIAGVPVDIKPMSCPNPLNVNNKGVLPVAILGTEDFDATQVDITTVTLAGVPAIPDKYEMEDVSTPFNWVFDYDCLDCTELGGDGMLDLVLHFYSQDIVDAIGSVEDGECLYPILTGTLFDGTPIEGSDPLRIIKKK